MPYHPMSLPERNLEPPDPGFHFFTCEVCGREDEHEYNLRENKFGEDVCPNCEDKFRCDYCEEICPDSEYYHHKWQANFVHLGLNIIKTYSDHLCPDCYEWEVDPNRE